MGILVQAAERAAGRTAEIIREVGGIEAGVKLVAKAERGSDPDAAVWECCKMVTTTEDGGDVVTRTTWAMGSNGKTLKVAPGAKGAGLLDQQFT